MVGSRVRVFACICNEISAPAAAFGCLKAEIIVKLQGMVSFANELGLLLLADNFNRGVGFFAFPAPVLAMASAKGNIPANKKIVVQSMDL